MISTQFSSGDAIADRRADYARMLSEAGDHAAAAELYEQALELVPLWTAGWVLAGEVYVKADRRALLDSTQAPAQLLAQARALLEG